MSLLDLKQRELGKLGLLNFKPYKTCDFWPELRLWILSFWTKYEQRNGARIFQISKFIFIPLNNLTNIFSQSNVSEQEALQFVQPSFSVQKLSSEPHRHFPAKPLLDILLTFIYCNNALNFSKLHLQPSQAVLGKLRNRTDLADCDHLEQHRLFQAWPPLIINCTVTFPHDQVRGVHGKGTG